MLLAGICRGLKSMSVYMCSRDNYEGYSSPAALCVEKLTAGKPGRKSRTRFIVLGLMRDTDAAADP